MVNQGENSLIGHLNLNYFFVFLFYVPVIVILFDSGIYLTAKYFGNTTTINYKGVGGQCSLGPLQMQLNNIWKQYQSQIDNNEPFPEKDKYDELQKEIKRQDTIIRIGGLGFELFIAGISFLALIILKLQKHTYIKAILIMLAFLWLTEPIKFILLLITRSTFPETTLSNRLNIPPLLFMGVLSVIGITICAYVFLKLIPKSERLSFVIGSGLGSVLGLVLWFKLIGPFVLPV